MQDSLPFLTLESKFHSVSSRKQQLVDADVHGLREMAQYGLKGLMAYFDHAERLRMHNANTYTDDKRDEVFNRVSSIEDTSMHDR
jgi:hypothetical protein